MVSCGENGQEPFITTEYGLYFESEMLCAGSSTKVRVMKTGTFQEVPISEIEFEPLPPSKGTITPFGIYTAPASINLENMSVAMQARFKKGGPEIIMGIIYNNPKDTSTDTWIQNATSDLAERWRYSTFENGDFLFTNPVQGWGSPANPTYELVKVSKEGKLLEKKTFGQGFSIFTKIKGEKIYSLGYKNQNPINTLSIDVFDSSLNLISQFLLPEGLVDLFDVDDSGNIYAGIWEEFDRTLVKINEKGELVWKSMLGYEFLSLKVDPEGNTYGLVRIPENPDKEALVKINTNGEEEWFVSTGRNATESILFLTREGNVGLGAELMIGSSNTWIQNFYTKDGELVVENRPLFQSFHLDSATPTTRLFDLANIHEIFVTKEGEVFYVGTASWGTSVSYIFVVSGSGEYWNWWELNPTETTYLYPIGISEDEDGLVLLSNEGNEFKSFRIRKNLTFNQCLYPAYWRTN
jgi:hypothetical protein